MPIRLKAQFAVRKQLLHGGFAFGMDTEEIIHLTQCDDHRNTGSKTGDDRLRDQMYEFTQFQKAGQQHQHARHQANEKNAGQIAAVLRDDGDKHRSHRTGGAGNLERCTGQRTDHKTGQDRRDQTRRGIRAAADAERQSQRQGNRTDGETRHDIGQKAFRPIALKLLFQKRYVIFQHVHSLIYMI